MTPTSQIDSFPTLAELVDLLRRSLSMCTRCGSVLSFPSLLISSAAGRLAELRAAGGTSADVAAGFFEQMGFRADRTKMNVYGYPGLLRDLAAPPPWIEVEPDDCEGTVPPSRARDLQPLFRLAADVPIPELLARYKAHLDERTHFMAEMLSSH